MNSYRTNCLKPKDKSLKETGIFGRVECLFMEPETHKRGSYHNHILMKLSDVPQISHLDELTKFWDQRITATIPCKIDQIQD